MQGTEVCLDISLEDPEVRRIVRHQFVNLIHVVHAELQLIERISGKINAFRDSIHLCEAAIRAFGERNTANGFRDELIDFRNQIVAPLTAFNAADASEEDIADIDDARRVLMSIIDAADVRVQEILARHQIARPWGDTELETVHRNVLKSPAGLGAAVTRVADCLGGTNSAQIAVETSDNGSGTVSVATPGVALPGSEFTTCGRIDYEGLRSDPDQAAKLALLGVYFVVLSSGSMEFTESELPNDTVLITIRPVA